MSRARKDTLKKLSAFKKEEIIEALGCSYNSEYTAEQMLVCLESKKEKDLLDKHGKAIDKTITARKAFTAWKTEMCEKYGDGQTVKLSNIPPTDISRGAALEKALKKATEEEQRLDKQVNRMLGLC